MEYLIVKWLHVLSSTVLFGTGLGSAYYMFFAGRTRDPKVVAAVTRHVVQADWWFTSTTIVFQPLSGWWLASLAGIPLATPWIAWSFALYLVAGACWIPVVWLQIQMRQMAEQCARAGDPLPPRYWAYQRIWVSLGIPAFVALVIVFYLMVVKPA